MLLTYYLYFNCSNDTTARQTQEHARHEAHKAQGHVEHKACEA